MDQAGNLYISDLSNNRVRRVDAQGIITTVAGNGVSGDSGDGGPAIGATLFLGGGLTFDQAGNLYISSRNWIRRVGTGAIYPRLARLWKGR